MKHTNKIKSMAVFCGSSKGTKNDYRHQAYELGSILAQEGIEIIYGGAKVGLMGHLADGALAAKGKITGVIPKFLREKEIAHDRLTRLIQVESMHERKQRMHELSDGVIALPGGYGTLEEFFETLTWGQLGLHRKPVALLNINGFYDPLKQLADSMVREGFLNPVNRQMLIINSNITGLLKQMKEQPVPHTDKWINQKQW